MLSLHTHTFIFFPRFEDSGKERAKEQHCIGIENDTW